MEVALDEVSHIVIHEMAHRVIVTVYPEIEKLWNENTMLTECIGELGGRILERIISEKDGCLRT